MNDLISRQAIMKEFADFVRKSNNSDFAQTPTWNDAVSLVGSMPSAQPETNCSEFPNNSDTISRQAAIDAVEALAYHADKYVIDSDVHEVHGFRTGLAVAERQLSLVPSAQPERKMGKWIKLDAHAHLADHKCSACGQECYVPTCMGDPMYDYCPNCGARMKEGEEHD